MVMMRCIFDPADDTGKVRWLELAFDSVSDVIDLQISYNGAYSVLQCSNVQNLNKWDIIEAYAAQTSTWAGNLDVDTWVNIAKIS